MVAVPEVPHPEVHAPNIPPMSPVEEVRLFHLLLASQDDWWMSPLRRWSTATAVDELMYRCPRQALNQLSCRVRRSSDCHIPGRIIDNRRKFVHVPAAIAAEAELVVPAVGRSALNASPATDTTHCYRVLDRTLCSHRR